MTLFVRRARTPTLFPILFPILLPVGLLASCHVFEPLSNCSTDADCEEGFVCNPDAQFCEHAGPILIGVTLALTGDIASFGQAMRTGIDVAEQIIDESEGVLGRGIDFIVLDDEGTTDVAERNVQALIERGVAGVIGPLKSGQALATQALTFAHELLQISPTAGSPSLGSAQPAHARFFFRTISTMKTGSGAAIARFARSDAHAKCARMAMIYTDDDTGAAFAEAVRPLFEKAGGCVVMDRKIRPGVLLSYDEEIGELIDLAPDCALLVAWPEAGAAIVRAFNAEVARRSAVFDFYWMGTTALRSSKFLESARVDPVSPTPNEAEGFFGGDTDSTPPSVEYRRFRTLYNEKRGLPLEQETPTLVANTYDAALLLALAIQAAGTTRDRRALRDGLWAVSSPDNPVFGPTSLPDALAALRRGDRIHYSGASSQLILDETGTPSNPTLVWKVVNGALEVVERFTEDDVEEIITRPQQPKDPACP